MSDGINFALTEEQKMQQALARDFARNEIAPVAEHYDRSAEFPLPVIEKARQAGLINTNVPMEYGGAGASLVEEVVVCEELAWGCTGISTSILINNLAAIPIIVAGTEEQKKEWLGRMTGGQLGAYAVTEPAAGSDVAGMLSTATKKGDEYVIKGSKTFISNASYSQFFVVFAYTDKAAKYKGISAFIVGVRDYMVEITLKSLNAQQPDPRRSRVPLEIVANSLSWSLLGVLIWWLEHDMPHTPEYMAEQFQLLITHDLKQVLGLE